ITGNATVADAVEALKLGAFDLVEKPHGLQRLESTVDRAYRHKLLSHYASTMAETALHWETTFDAVPDLVAIVDAKGRLVRVNKPMAARAGIEPSEAMGRSFDDILHRSVASGGDLNQAFSEVYGGAFLVTSSPLVTADGEPIGAVHVAR